MVIQEKIWGVSTLFSHPITDQYRVDFLDNRHH
jgi:hypothetical protein